MPAHYVIYFAHYNMDLMMPHLWNHQWCVHMEEKRMTEKYIITWLNYSSHELVYVNVQTCSCHVLNNTWSAECAEFACIVIELVIGSYCLLQTFNVFCVSLTNYSSCFEGKLLLLITVFKHYNYYIVITFGFSITTTWIITC